MAGLICILLFRKTKEEYALFTGIMLNVMLIFLSVNAVLPVIEYVKNIENSHNLGNMVEILFKCTAVAFIFSVASSISKDCGESGLASKIELLGKCLILSMCLPLIKTAFSEVNGIISG
jgi:stage III sporulation protein AD